MNLREVQPVEPNQPVKPSPHDRSLSTIQLIVSAVSGVAFYHYAVNIHNEWSCHAGHIPGNDEVPDPNLGLHCVSTLFLRLLYLGLIISIVGFASAVLKFFYLISAAEHLGQIQKLLNKALGIATLAWLVAATVIRYRKSGLVCSGYYAGLKETTYPYEYEQGKFLNMVIITLWSIPLVACTVGCCNCFFKNRTMSQASEQYYV